AKRAQRDWGSWAFEDRAAVLLRAADLLTGKYRADINAATMLGQSKTVHQSEIDAACELGDFFRFNVAFARELIAEQPISGEGMWNQTDYRPLEGFVYAISPFNFTAIGGNLVTSPALMGNVVLWKPAHTSMRSAWVIMNILEEAGMPPGVVNLVTGDSRMITDVVLSSPDLAGVHFTGSTGVFQSIWSRVGKDIAKYRAYPRLVGETGGKDFIVAHPSASPQEVAVAMIRGGFEYQGQKCSAASRVYLPKSLAKDVIERTVAIMKEIKIGDTSDFRNFMGAVISESAFDSIAEYIDHARKHSNIVSGGGCNKTVGYFIEPTLVEAKDPGERLMCEEIFGPVLTYHVYPDEQWAQMLNVVDSTSPYALTGAVFSRDRRAVQEATHVLRNAAGNFYINDKPTGAVVGQQPFGGARGSGTNDKAGSKMNLMRWVQARTIKETFAPATDWRYPFLAAE
ncbi:MAG: L-glutamate gamma-semialdehyde dehydrogenase, partial [Vicinamibacteria bacterium]|nr:L-glutamate gamma-semialdehyde dehydrogenase [Vicinamibacteria bacterium]